MSESLVKIGFLPETSQLTPNSPFSQFRLGRHPHFDERSRQFRVKVDHTAALKSQMWDRPAQPFNQGNVGSCTGNGCVGCLATAPYNHDGVGDNVVFNEQLALRVYGMATLLDPIVGTYPPDDTGSTVLAAMKAAKKMGLIKGYEWCFGLQDVLQTLSHHGSVEVGVTWYEGFFNPDANGQIHLSGSVAGGHAFQLIGIDVEKKLVWAVNSWGHNWGKDGRFCMSWDLLDTLLKEGGEAVHVVCAKNPPKKSFWQSIFDWFKSLFGNHN